MSIRMTKKRKLAIQAEFLFLYTNRHKLEYPEGIEYLLTAFYNDIKLSTNEYWKLAGALLKLEYLDNLITPEQIHFSQFTKQFNTLDLTPLTINYSWDDFMVDATLDYMAQNSITNER